jgi:uncharacterized protein
MGTEVERGRPFLTAEWRNLVMLNYEIEPAVLSRYVPRGVEVDAFEGRSYVSVVGFQFLGTKLGGRLAIPWHSNFDEVNLRFYVRRVVGGEVRRGVVFVSEIVPRRAIAVVARVAYNENYFCYPMSHEFSVDGERRGFRYAWQKRELRYAIEARTSRKARELENGSMEQFITEHYWGYAKQRDGGTVEYRVAHEPWRVWNADEANLDGDVMALYGAEFGEVLSGRTRSALVADGSDVQVYSGKRVQF